MRRSSSRYTLGRVAQSVICLAKDACLTADPGVANSIPARSHTLVEIDHEIICMIIILPSADSFKEGCCQVQGKVCALITGSDFIWDFGKLPFPAHLGKYLLKNGKISTKIHEIGKIKTIF